MLMNFINTFRLFSSNESPILGTTTIRLKNNEQKRKLEEIQMERKVVLITGGAMGQGKAHALKYAQNGFDVVLADMQGPEGETFKATVARSKPPVQRHWLSSAISARTRICRIFCKGMGDLWSFGCGHCQRWRHQLWLYLGADRRTGGKGHQHRPDRHLAHG